jgi:protocatechuate 4,5-dioxygenase alpha subunit
MVTVVLIPGLVSDGHVWADAVAALAPLAVVVADVTTQDSIPDMARSLLARHGGRLVLAGHSMGGRVAMEMARMAPGRVAGMALLNTGIHPRREAEVARRLELVDLAQGQGMAALAAAWLPGMLRPGGAADPAVLAGLTAMVCRMTPAIHARQVRALLERPDAGASLAYRGPMLLIAAEEDVWSPVAQHAQIASLCPQARLEVVAGAGHFAPVEQGARVARLLADWAGAVVADDARLDRIPDTPLFDRPRAAAGYALNKMAMGLSTPAGRAAFLADEGAYLDSFALSPAQRAAVLARDWEAMVRLGGNLFYILKISAVDPTPIRAIGAAQAGMSLDAFLETRLGKVTNG